MTHAIASCGLLAAFLSLPASAQDGAGNQAQQLRAALVKMSKLTSVAFRSLEVQDVAMLRGAGIGPQEQEVSGAAADGLLAAEIDEDRVVFANGRMVALGEGGKWHLRRDCRADGGPLPFVHDPLLAFSFLAELPDSDLKVTQVEPTKSRDRDVLVYTVTVTGQAALDVSYAGLLPKGNSGPGRMIAIGGGGGGMRMPPPEVTVDLAFYVDPSSNDIVRLHTKAYTKSNMPAGMVMRVAGAGGVEIQHGGEDDEDDSAAAKDGPVTIKKGLPVRKLGKDLSLTEFDVSYSKHGGAQVEELPQQARSLLGLR